MYWSPGYWDGLAAIFGAIIGLRGGTVGAIVGVIVGAVLGEWFRSWALSSLDAEQYHHPGSGAWFNMVVSGWGGNVAWWTLSFWTSPG
jgi:hypothetical protein